MDFNQLTHEDFEVLCGRLIQADGNELREQPPRSQDIGVDHLFQSSDGELGVCEVKHSVRPRTGSILLRQASAQLSNARDFLGASRALLVVSMLLPDDLKQETSAIRNIEIWDSRDVNARLQAHPNIERTFQQLAAARVSSRVAALPVNAPDRRAEELITCLDSVPAGKAGWRQYEEVCIEMLNYAFYPNLGVPVLQSSTEDGLDRRDAIYPISKADAFWNDVRDLCRTRFVVAEFKNFNEPIGQREVESIEQYLYVKARRTFGLLCSRRQPSSPAVAARRRAWTTDDHLILFLSDTELKDLVRAKNYGESPSAVLDAQLNQFLMVLAP